MKNLAVWLEALGLAQYAEAFATQKVEFDLLSDLTDADLEKLGVAALGDRKRLLKAIAAIAHEGSAPPSPRTTSSSPLERLPERDAERRQLTVMFCDLVGSTELATVLDPEDFRHVIGTYHDAVTKAVSAHTGYVAQLLGDGVLVYFGYPTANEDDAAVAIRAAADVLSAVDRLNISGRRLQTRIGIATGVVVVGAIGAGTPAAELSASGDTPNLAARLESQAEPGCIVISDQTRALIGNAFDLEPLGMLKLKGFQAPVRAWQFVGEHPSESRFEAVHSDHLSPFVGRDSEVALLLERWSTACEGECQTVLLSGEAGIGKSRITQILRQRVSSGSVESLLLQCSPSHRNSALYPVVHALEIAGRLAGVPSLSEREARLGKYLADHGASPPRASFKCLLRLVAPPNEGESVSVLTDQTPLQQKQSTLQALTDIVLAISRRTQVLLMIEDAHWIDPTTDEWVGKAIDQLRDSRVLVVITCRPEYSPSWDSPLNLTRLTVNRLSHRQAAALVASVTGGKSLPKETLEAIIVKTDGVPLFIEELTKTVLASDLLEDTATGYRLRESLKAPAIPSTLQDSLMARLDRLGRAKEVAQVAAAIGRDFSQTLLADVMQVSEGTIALALDELLRVGIVFRRGSTQSDASFTFKHALIRDVAYNSMTRSQRASLHANIAQTLELTSRVLILAQPELLAQHHQEAGNDREAIRYWDAAGDLAWGRSAGLEATSHYANAIALIPRLPLESTRKDLELKLNLKRGHALSVTEGYGSQTTFRSYERARELARELGRIEDFVNAWSSSAPTLFGAGRSGEAIESMKEVELSQLTSLAPSLRVAAMCNLGCAHFLTGAINEGWAYLDAARLLDDAANVTHIHPVGGGDPAIAIRAYCIRIKGLQGYLEQAEMLADESMQIAHSRGHPPTIAWAMQSLIQVLLLKGEYSSAESTSVQMLELSERFGFKTRIATCWVHMGRAKVLLGKVDAGLEFLKKGCDLWASAGGKFHLAEYQALAADVLLGAGRLDEARQFLAEAQAVQASTDERYYESELLRLSGRIRNLDGDVSGAEACYEQAIHIAEMRGLKLLSLRAGCDLCRLRMYRDASEALELLRSLYAWFTEGSGFLDLREAKALLDEVPR